MNEPNETLTIGTFAQAAGVNVETIRFYQRKGLLRQPQKLYGSIRRYGDRDVMRIRFIKSAQRLGFNLDEIAQLLKLEDGTSCSEVAEIAEQRLDDVRARVEDDIGGQGRIAPKTARPGNERLTWIRLQVLKCGPRRGCRFDS